MRTVIILKEFVVVRLSLHMNSLLVKMSCLLFLFLLALSCVGRVVQVRLFKRNIILIFSLVWS